MGPIHTARAVTEEGMRDTVHRYCQAWAARDRARVRQLLQDRLTFTSPQDSFDSADCCLSACWHYSTGLAGARFVPEVYEEDRAFVVLQWSNEDGTTSVDAEYLEMAGGKIKRILVVNNDLHFEGLVG
jgi:ketosteroid isomerase-like protein